MEKIIQRKLLKDLHDHLSSREISLITGPRQVGKTTLMRALEKSVNEQGGKTVFLDRRIS